MTKIVEPTWLDAHSKRCGGDQFSGQRAYQLALRKNINKLTVYINAKSWKGKAVEAFLPPDAIEEKYPNTKGIHPSNSLLSESNAPYLTPNRNVLLRITLPIELFSEVVSKYLDVDRTASQLHNINSTSDTSPDNSVSLLIDVNSMAGVNKTDPLLPFASTTDPNKNEIRTYQGDPVKRKVIENHAVERAILHYTSMGYTVNEMGKPYDLLCSSPAVTVHVEVKGTTGNGDKVILTRNEIKDARNPTWRSDLFIVRNIQLRNEGDQVTACGGDELIHETWQPSDNDLEPVQFEYRVPPKS